MALFLESATCYPVTGEVRKLMDLAQSSSKRQCVRTLTLRKLSCVAYSVFFVEGDEEQRQQQSKPPMQHDRLSTLLQVITSNPTHEQSDCWEVKKKKKKKTTASKPLFIITLLKTD